MLRLAAARLESQVCYSEIENDMPLNETDKTWIRQEIQNALKRQGRGKVIGFIKDWSGIGGCVAILIFILLQWTAYVEFRTQTNDRLGVIEKGLTTLQLQSQISLPQAAFGDSMRIVVLYWILQRKTKRLMPF